MLQYPNRFKYLPYYLATSFTCKVVISFKQSYQPDIDIVKNRIHLTLLQS